jgi:2,3-bisphosphoglycerate-dependent phosphoglycerate mutase
MTKKKPITPLQLLFSLALLLVLGFSAHAQDKQVTTFILVRHAEKVADGSKDPELSEVGKARALRLANMLKKQNIAAIYSTNYKRTLNTVKPLAEQLGQTVLPYEPFKDEEIVKMVNEHKGKTVLIVGHSNNIPWIANTLLGKKEFGDYDESYYENVLIVNVIEKGVNGSTLQISY